jgi:hypothetical protein
MLAPVWRHIIERSDKIKRSQSNEFDTAKPSVEPTRTGTMLAVRKGARNCFSQRINFDGGGAGFVSSAFISSGHIFYASRF